MNHLDHIPLVSVVMPVYNGANFVRQAVDSVLAQTLQDFELVVIDDGSTDETPVILAQYGSRLRYYRQENQGAGAAFNHGIRQARGRYISWLSHDDMYAPEKLERQVAALERLGRPGGSYTYLSCIDDAGKFVWEWVMPEYPLVGGAVLDFLLGRPICGAPYSLLYSKSCLETSGFYDESLKYAQDADFFIRLALKYPLVLVPYPLTLVREHAARGMRAQAAVVEREILAFCQKWLSTLDPDTLLPAKAPFATRRARASARIAIGDDASVSTLFYPRLAPRQYWMALKEWPPSVRYVLPLILRYWRKNKVRRIESGR